MSGLLVAGTTSDAGKSLVVTGLCRAFARRGVRVAPYKAQNMSNNSMVCAGSGDDGVEIGRAQWVQAVAARVTPEAAMNPVLLKPGSDRRSHVVLMGKPWGEVSSSDWLDGRRALAATAHAAYDDLPAEVRQRVQTYYAYLRSSIAASPAEQLFAALPAALRIQARASPKPLPCPLSQLRRLPTAHHPPRRAPELV